MLHPPWAVGVVAAIALLVSSCGLADPAVPGVPVPGGGPSPSVAVPPAAANQPTPTADPPDAEFPTPNRSFATHFADPLYHDESGEFAPFGTDEGWDTLYAWNERRDDLNRCTTVRWMFGQEDPVDALDDPDHNGPDADGFIIGTGFSLLLFSGHIDSEGKRLTLDALQRTYSFYAIHQPREIAVMIRDLERFPASDCTKP